MDRIPNPRRTERGPEYEGRLLTRPGDEVVDQGVGFDLRTLLTRRNALALLGAGATTALLAACTARPAPAPGGSSGQSGPTGGVSAGAEIPEETAGPYPGDGSNGVNVLKDAGVIRSDIRSSLGGRGATTAGIPLTIALTILDSARGGAPFRDAAVYVWQCDAEGRYSLYSDGVTDESYLRGVQVADAEGTVTFTSIFPGCYPGRWPHIHFEVYPTADAITDSSNAIATSQIALPEDVSRAVYATDGYDGSTRNLSRVSLATDMVFGNDGGALQLGTMTGGATSGYHVALVARVDTTTPPGA